MLQIKIVPGSKEASEILMKDNRLFILLRTELIRAVLMGFRIPDGCQSGISVIVNSADHIYNEANVQIEVCYNENIQGRALKPTLNAQEKVADLMQKAFATFLLQNELSHLSLSVWCKPFRNSAFKQWP